MKKIQYGIAGFFTGAFLGLLIGIIEMRVISSKDHPTLLFVTMALTVMVSGIFGIVQALKFERKNSAKGRN